MKRALLLALTTAVTAAVFPQANGPTLSLTPSLTVSSVTDRDGHAWLCPPATPLFSLEVDGTPVSAGLPAGASRRGHTVLRPGIDVHLETDSTTPRGWLAVLTVRNSTEREVKVSNLVPFGKGPDRITIDAAPGPLEGPGRLSRTRLERPGFGPIGVILPDNAWELGFCDLRLSPQVSLVAITRRVAWENADRGRFFTMLRHGGWVRFHLYADLHSGPWQEGLRLMFRERWLYDMDSFDTTLFDREDLRWIRFTYVLVLRFAWDREYHNARAGASTFEGSLGCFDRLLGKTDGFILWPTWPRLGLDGRNQFDLFADLPGGFDGLRRQAEYARAHGTKFFVCHNPWDTGTRSEDHLAGLERLLRGTDADGVVLDTRGASDRQLQQTADRVKPGIVLYSEGMAVPKEMPGIVAGRVHDALVLPPPLNLNKVIRPDFAIFRVLQLADGRLHREAGIALFNGHGVEINVMRPGSPAWLDEELRYLGRTVRILREHSSAFLSHDWTPLFPAAADSIWVNRWATPEKTLYTIFSLRPDGWSSPLFVLPRKAGAHLVDVWNHTELPHTSRGDSAAVTVEGFSRSWLGSRREGNVGCIALLPQLLTVSLDGDSLSLSAPRGDSVLVWAGDPAYDGSPSVFRAGSRTVSLRNFMGFYEGKVVVQLFDGGELADERIVEVPPGTPRLVSTRQATLPAGATPPGMMEIPAGRYVRAMTGTDASDSFFPVPGRHGRDTVCMPRFWMDRYPVTNEEFRAFLLASGYTPDDTTNFLRHWSRGHPPRGMEQHPVVWVSYDDARAFARWAGKRLPTSFEWQYAAQGSDGRRYPWGDSLEAGRYNPGTGTTSPVNRYPSGASPFGVADMVGNVWQLMDELYSDGRYTFGILRGGSYYAPAGSEWYIRGGPRPVDRMQILLMVSPGFDRSATVGFRCVRDAE